MIPQERALVVGIGLKKDDFRSLKESLSEMEELSWAAGAEVVGTLVQILPQFIPATLMGSGKVLEIKVLCEETKATLVLVDHRLNGVQTRNLQTALGLRVLDRSQLILDIFAMRAQTHEGKLQVELAQKLDQLPRMIGAWHGSLSRLGGGIGTRGPGETALEIDRRRIHERVRQIQKKLDVVRQNRAQHRSKRKKMRIPSLALIGYTNAGKSSLFNLLTKSQTQVKDQLFATLDPTTRQMYLPGEIKAVLTDTVGFIRNLPVHLIEAFKATLEESAEADILIHVIDSASPQMDVQIQTVLDLVKDLGWESKPIVHVYNKADLIDRSRSFSFGLFPRAIVSATTGQGLELLRKSLVEMVQELLVETELFFSKSEENLIFELSREATVLKTEPASTGTLLRIRIPESKLSKWSHFLLNPQ